MMSNRLNWLLSILTIGGLTATATAESTPEAFSLAPPAAAVQPVDGAPAAATPPALPSENCCAPCCPKPFQITLGFRTWFTQGNSDDTILTADGPDQFRFRDVEATVYEFNIDAVLRNRFVARVDLGFGLIDDGNFQEIVPPADGPTLLPAAINNDDLFYVTADAGYRLFSRGDSAGGCTKLAIDAFVGYQHWQETFVINNEVGLALAADTYTWNSLRLGTRASLEAGRWATQARVAYVPWTHFESKVVNNSLVEDYKEKADGGQGVMADFTVSYRVWRGLSLDLGYQVFHLTSEPGSFRSAVSDIPMENAHSTRHGLLVGLNYRF